MAHRWLAPGLIMVLLVVPLAFAPALYDDFSLPKQLTLLLGATALLGGVLISGAALVPASSSVRALLAATIVTLVISTVAGVDPLGSVLGLYQYRQGLLTQGAYIAVLIGTASAFRLSRSWTILRWGTAGLVVVTVYSGLQLARLDPFAWWVDTSTRAIGTVGNANELAAYAVIATGTCAAWSFPGRRRTALCVAGVTALSSFLVLAAASRAGLVALGISVLSLPLALAIVRSSRRDIALRTGAVIVGVGLGTIASFPLGGAQHESGRLEDAIGGRDPAGVTRLALWEGTIATIRASPWIGFGPDGLALAFPRFRPADLDGAFDDYDLVAKSSHNWLLDLSATGGLPFAVSTLALLAVIVTRSIAYERAHGDVATAHVFAALSGYFALTLVDPVAITGHAFAWLVVGALLGRTDGLRLPSVRSRRAGLYSPRLVFAGAVAPALVLSALAIRADLAADDGWDAYAARDFEDAALNYQRASRLNPLEPAYARSEAQAWLALGATTQSPSDLARAEDAFEELESRFEAASGDEFGLATARIGLHANASDVLRPVELGVKRNPHGVAVASYASLLRYAAAFGGALRYSERDRWVYVEPFSPPLSPENW